ncbi:group II intron maturase-specific domain-containing protein [Pseudomonas sp. NPDC077186]|uniref:group II intron maturase-specific domain-containing protein n=1 Tax=Pseudomonas sp. NPDC077186 TaxID=3364421 RepID=UPI0037C834B3
MASIQTWTPCHRAGRGSGFGPSPYHGASSIYHLQIVAKATFNRVDDSAWHMLWRWAKRRHPAKSAWWIKKRYFRTIGDRTGDFSTKGSADGRLSAFGCFVR